MDSVVNEREQDRILATCEENGLEYVTDQTNFQPEATLRNAVRHVLRHGKVRIITLMCASNSQVPFQESAKDFPPNLQEQIATIDKSLQDHPSFEGDLDSGSEKLGKFVLQLSEKVEKLEKKGTLAKIES